MGANIAAMTRLLTRRELAQQALAGTTGVLLSLAQPTRAQVVDPLPTPPPLPASKPIQNALSMPTQSTQASETTPSEVITEGTILTRLVPVAAGYSLSETQTKEVAAQLQDYPGGFAKARAYALPDDIGPAFAAAAPVRKERVK